MISKGSYSNGLAEVMFDARMIALGEIDKKYSRSKIVETVMQWEFRALERIEKERFPAWKAGWIADLAAIQLYKSSRNIR